MPQSSDISVSSGQLDPEDLGAKLVADPATPVEIIALSDKSHLQRVRECIGLHTGEYIKNDLTYSVLGALIGGAFTLLDGSLTLSTVLYGTVGFFIVLVVRVIKHGFAASAELDAAIRKQSTRLHRELLAEKARNAKPQLVGDVICLEVHPNLDMKDGDYDCFLTLSLLMRNNSAGPTMVSGFSLELNWEGQDFPGVRESLNGYHVKRYSRQPANWETKHETLWDPLSDFPYHEEVTNRNHKIGWLRFSVGAVPLNAVKSERPKKEVTIKLTALDSRREPHLIYEGTTWLSGCGTIQRSKKMGQFKTTQDGPVLESFEVLDDF